jgi:hypothetical protein
MSEETLVDSAPAESTSDVSSTPASESSAPDSGSAAPSGSSEVWSSFRSLPDFQGQDDTQIAGRLYASLEREKSATKALQQYQQLIPYAQEYLTHRESFERWRDQQSRPQQPQPVQQQSQSPAQKGWWNPPEVRESYKRYLVKDESGREVVSPDAPLDAKHALYEYQKYKADFAQKFLTDPQAALGPMVEQVASERAKEIVEQQLREVGEQGYVQTLEQQNSDWLYEKDGKTPSREGLMIQRYINEAAKAGYGTPQQRWQYACDMVERDLLRQVLEERDARPAAQAFQQALRPQAAPQAATPAAVAQAPAPQNQAEKDIEYLRREASRNPSRSGPSSDPRTPKGPMTFEQRLRAQMAREGIE